MSILKAPIFDRPDTRAAARNFGWLVTERLVRLVFNVFVGFIVARYLGPTQFGALNYALAMAGLAAAVAEMGIESVVKREIIQVPERTAALLTVARRLRWVAGSVCYFTLLLWVWCYESDRSSRILLVIVGMILFQPAMVVSNLWLQANLLARTAALAQSIALIVGGGARLLLIVLGAPLWGFGAVIVGESFLAAVLLTNAASRAGMRVAISKDTRLLARRLMGESWPLLISGLTIMIYMRIDVVMLRNLAGPDAVGVYAAAVRISEVWFFLPAALCSSLLPGLLKARASGAADYRTALQGFFDINVGLAYVLSVPTALLAPWIVTFAYGVDFAPAGPVLAVHSWTLIGAALGVARGQFCVNEGYTRFHLAATATGAAINILLNLCWIPRYGAVGAAWATLIAQILAAWLSSFCFFPVVSCALIQSRALLFPIRLIFRFFDRRSPEGL